jgi:transglutaminase-like putative cysteine protease
MSPPVRNEDIEELDEGGLLTAPPEGWTSLFCLVVMFFMAAYAVDDSVWAGYVAGSHLSQTSFLPVGVVGAVFVGLLLARSRLKTVAAHVAGAAVGTAYLLVAVSGAISVQPTLEGRLLELSISASTFVGDVFVLGIRSSETSVFLLVIGALLWAAAQLGAFSLFRRRRAGPAIALSGTALLINMSITVQDQWPLLIVFAAAALVLAVRLNLLSQTESWRLRRIGDGGSEAASLFMRSGAAFVGVAVIGSIVLAANASSAPLSRAWRGFDDTLLEVGLTANRLLGGVSGGVRGPSNLFTPSQTIREVWEASSTVVFSAAVSDGGAYYWRGATYDSFDGRTWHQLDRQATIVAAGDHIFGTGADLPTGVWRTQVIAKITAQALGGDVMVAPDSPDQVDQATVLQTIGNKGGFVSLKLVDGISAGTQYTVSSQVPQISGFGALTAAQLAAAGRNYPDWLAPYREITPGAVGDATYAETERIVGQLPANQRDPFHIADAIQTYLHDGEFKYDTDLRGLCVGENWVDCFLRIRRGYCEYFASAMTMMLRTQDIPARYVLGYLPGQKQPNGTWQVDGTAAHAWVEAFFPGYGWIRFDPTPGNDVNGQAPTRLAPGDPSATARPQQPDSSPDIPSRIFEDEDPTATPPSASPPGSGPDVPTLLGLLVLFAAGSLVAFSALRLRTTRPVEPHTAYRGVAGLATRFGHGPLPTQTVYEFTDSLSQLLPAIGPELHTVAVAKVEASYSGRPVTHDLLDVLASAYRRVRLGLLRLVVRRPVWFQRPRWIRRRRS